MPRTLGQVVAGERKLRQKDNDAGKEARRLLIEAKVTGQLNEYKPDKDDEDLPASERSTSQLQPVQSKVHEVLHWTRGYAEAALNAVATKDATNMTAKADITLPNGNLILANVGISHLLWLEKYLVEWRGFLVALPVLSPTKRWSKVDSEEGLWRADPEETPRTAKVFESLVLHNGNDKHPPQAQAITKDIKIGRKITTVHSGAITVQRRQQLVDQCDELIVAVREAISRANTTPAVEVTDEGAAIMSYLLG